MADALRSGIAGSRALELFDTTIRSDTAGHLTEILNRDLDIFTTAMQEEPTLATENIAQTVPRMTEVARAGSHGLAATVALLT